MGSISKPMTGRGDISVAPRRNLRILIFIQALWLLLVLVMGLWWTKLVQKQAFRISELEKAVGMAVKGAEAVGAKVHRMIFWESSAYFILLVGASLVLIWLYWREMMRTRSLQAFFASLTHELRTPLTSIRLQAESLQEGLVEQGIKTSLVERLLRDTLRLESQVERTLELARVEGGGKTYVQPLSLYSFLERMLEPWREAHSGRLVLDLTEVDPDLVVSADSTSFSVVIRNILENALKHGGKTKVVLTFVARVRQNKISLEITDSGKGTSEDVKRLGHLFEKGASSSGAGVGLYLVSTLMTRMGGRAQFKSPVFSDGTGFCVTLWFQSPQAAEDGTL